MHHINLVCHFKIYCILSNTNKQLYKIVSHFETPEHSNKIHVRYINVKC